MNRVSLLTLSLQAAESERAHQPETLHPRPTLETLQALQAKTRWPSPWSWPLELVSLPGVPEFTAWSGTSQARHPQVLLELNRHGWSGGSASLRAKRGAWSPWGSGNAPLPMNGPWP